MKEPLSLEQAGEIGLSCRVTWTIYAEEMNGALAGQQLPAFLSPNAPAEQVFQVTLARAGGRIDLSGSSCYGHDISLIRRHDGTGICLSHGDRSFVLARTEEMGPARFERPLTCQWDVPQRHEGQPLPEGQMDLVACLHDLAGGRDWQQHLYLDPNEELRSFALPFFELLFGPGDVLARHGYQIDELAAIFEQHGFPIGGRLDLDAGPDARGATVVSFSVSDVRLAPIQPEHFAIPADYLDTRLRENWQTLHERAASTQPVILQARKVRRPGANSRQRSGPAFRIPNPIRNPDGNDDGEGPTDRPGPDEPIERDDPLVPVETMEPLPGTTFGSAVALRIEQNLLTDLVRTLNDIAVPLSGVTVTASGGDVRFDWLGALKSQNTFIYCILHEDTSQQEPEPVGRGLLDGSAFEEVRALFNTNQYPRWIFQKTLPEDMRTEIATQGDWWGALPVDVRARLVKELTDRGYIIDLANKEKETKQRFNRGGYPAFVIQTLPESMKAAIAAGADLWVRLKPATQARLAREYVERIYGVVSLVDAYDSELTGAWPDGEPDGEFALLGFRVSNLGGSITLPPAVKPGETLPFEAAIFGPMTCNANGTISGSLDLGGARFTGMLDRWTTPMYWAVAGGSAIITMFFPAYAWVTYLIAAAGVFAFSDSANATITAAPLTATFTVSWEQPKPMWPFQPKVRTTLNRSVSAQLDSVVPTGLHQLVDLVLGAVANASGVLIDKLEGSINKALAKKFTALLGGGFPSWAWPDIPVLGGTLSGADGKYIMVEAHLGNINKSGLSRAPQPANWNLSFEMGKVLARLKATSGLRSRHYFSSAINVNAINQLQAVLWQRGEYQALLSSAARALLQPLLKPPFPQESFAYAELFAVSPPGIILTGSNATPMAAHCRVDFDRMVLELGPYGGQGAAEPSQYYLVFRASVDGYFGFGRPTAPAGTLDLQAIQPHLFDLYFDLATAQATVIGVSEKSIVTIEVQDADLDPRKPYVTRTVKDTVEQQTDHAIPPASEASLRAAALVAFKSALQQKRSIFIPRFDGLKSDGNASLHPVDGLLKQSYRLNAKDPDDLPALPPFMIAVDLDIVSGNLFAHGGPFGLIIGFLQGIQRFNAQTCASARALYDSLKSDV